MTPKSRASLSSPNSAVRSARSEIILAAFSSLPGLQVSGKVNPEILLMESLRAKSQKILLWPQEETLEPQASKEKVLNKCIWVCICIAVQIFFHLKYNSFWAINRIRQGKYCYIYPNIELKWTLVKFTNTFHNIICWYLMHYKNQRQMVKSL